MQRSDEENGLWLEAVVGQRGWPHHSDVGEDGTIAAFLLAQHAPDHERQRRFLSHMREAVAHGEARSEDLALLEDRVRMHLGLPQLYGSQFRVIGEELHLHEVEDPDRLDERRAAVGLEPFAEYERRLGHRYLPHAGGQQADDA